jgi:hypothetical protein
VKKAVLGSRDLHYSNSVSMKTLCYLFIDHGNHDDSFVEVIMHSCICMVFGYDLLCDFIIRNVEFNKYRERCCNSQKPSRSNSANEYESLMAERFESRWILFLI